MNAADVRAWLDETIAKFPIPDDETVDRIASLLRSAPEVQPVNDPVNGGGPRMNREARRRATPPRAANTDAIGTVRDADITRRGQGASPADDLAAHRETAKRTRLDVDVMSAFADIVEALAEVVNDDDLDRVAGHLRAEVVRVHLVSHQGEGLLVGEGGVGRCPRRTAAAPPR